MAESETGADTSTSVTNKWPGYCKTFLVKEPNGNIKELVFPKALDLDRPKRDRTTFSSRQLKQLEEEFMCNQYVVGKDRTRLAKSLGLTETQVKVWFQNRRTKLKKDKEHRDSATDPQAESKAAQNVLKLLSLRTSSSSGLLSLRTSSSSGFSNFQSKLSIPQLQGQAEEAEADFSNQRVTSSPEFSKSGFTKNDAFRGCNDVHWGGLKSISMGGNFTQAAPGIDVEPQATRTVSDRVMNQSKANCRFPVQAIPSFAPRNDSKVQAEQQSEIGVIVAPADLANRTTDNTLLLGNSGEQPSYFGQGDLFLPQFTGLPSWLGDYQRLNMMRHSSTHWHHNQHQTSHFAAQHMQAGFMGSHAYQNHNVYGEVHPSGQWLQQMTAAPAGYVWRYIHPEPVKKLQFQNQSNGMDEI